METTFNAYDKRVTLNLALHSAAAAQKPELLAALQKLPALGWDLYQLPQADIEIIYAEFDATFEQVVKDEFEADPQYLIDLGHAGGSCPLCGHQGCRWIFRINNLKGGQSVECGSECIIVHGLHVKGAETAEHARKALETAIRKAMRKLLIEKWHKDYDFSPSLFDQVADELALIRVNYTGVDSKTRLTAHYKQRDLKKLCRFYGRNGWLGTEKKWGEWIRIVSFVRQASPKAKATIPFQKAWMKPAAEEKVELVPSEPAQNPPEDPSYPHASHNNPVEGCKLCAELKAKNEELAQKWAEKQAAEVEEKVEPAPSICDWWTTMAPKGPDFSALASQVVFGQ